MKVHFYTHSYALPEMVTVTKQDHWLKFSGPLGSTYLNLKKIDPKGLGAVALDSRTQKFSILSPSKAFFGLFKKLIENKLRVITRGFLLYIKIVGIGYRATLTQETIHFKLGYSHDLQYKVPSSIKVFLLDPTLICLFGVDKNQITQIAAKIRDFRKPSAYKGKGIRLLKERIILKQGKKK